MGYGHLLPLILAILPFASAYPKGGWTPDAYPNPTTNPIECGRQTTKGWICDPDQILTQEQGLILQNLLYRINAETNATCNNKLYGFQIGIAIVRKMNPQGNSIGDASEQFARSTFDRWGVGYADCQTGILIFLTIDDRYLYIKTGAVAKDYLTDYEIDNVRQQYMNPQLKMGNYYQALYDGVNEIFSILEGNSHSLPLHIVKYIVYGVITVIGLIMVCIACCATKMCGKCDKESKCKDKLRKLQKERMDSKLQQYQPTTCPICLEDLPSQIVYIGDEENPNQPRSTTVLLCGHTFCTGCLKSLQTNQCPICRAPIYDQGHNYNIQKQRYYNQMSDQEFDYRLNRLSYMYPTYITSYHVNKIRQSSYSDDYVRTCFPVTHSSFPSSSGGHSFGGGHSSGGGGSGGSW